MVPNHKLPTMLYALALVSETSLLGTGVIFALVVAISRKVHVNVDCHSSSWLLCVMPPSFTATEAGMRVSCFTEHALVPCLTFGDCNVCADNPKALSSIQA